MGESVRLLVGLGNPGIKYRATRHNVGFMVVDCLAREWGWKWRTVPYRALVASGTWENRDVLLVKPQTMMNLSGRAVEPAFRRHGLGAGDLVVVHDDLDLPLGRLKVKMGGGDGGHRGVRSVAEATGTRDFLRIKVGIGRPDWDLDVVDYVLRPFEREEIFLIKAIVTRAAEALMALLMEEPEPVMNRFNSQITD